MGSGITRGITSSIPKVENPNSVREKMLFMENRRILHLSDLHFESNMEERCSNLKTKSLFNWIVKKYEDNEEKPIVIITGDLTCQGMEDDMVKLRDHLRILKDYPVRVVIGNHDIGTEETWKRSPNRKIFREIFKDYVIDYRRQDFPSIIMLDSMVGEEEILWFNGGLGEDQRNAVLEKVRRSYRTFRIFCMHHHPFNMKRSSKKCKIRDSKEFLDMIFTERIELVLFGHGHNREAIEGRRKGRMAFFVSSGSSTFHRDDGHKENEKVRFTEIILDRRNTKPILQNYTLDLETKKVTKKQMNFVPRKL